MIELLMLLNAARIQPLALDADLSARAQARAEHLCDHPFSHEGWRAWVADVPGHVGENLARGFSSSEAMHGALMASPGHRANIVSDRYTRVGLGEACGVTVQVFAS